MDEKRFIDRFRVNDYSQFDEFYKLTSKQIYFTALGILKSPDKAEDIVQDTYKSFLENIDSYKLGSNIFAYLTVIARNKSLNELKKYSHISYDEDALSKIESDGNFEEMEIEEILSYLSDSGLREIVVYHVIIGYKFREISKIVDEPLGTVLWKYNKAIKILREKVSL